MRKNRSISPRQLALLAVVALAMVLPLAAHATNFNVSATADLTFVPKNLTIHVGDSVTWTNSSGLTHNVRADDNSFRCAMGCDGDGHGGDGTPIGSWTFTKVFNQVGTIPYHCEIHGPTYGMVGSIVVQAASSAGTLGFEIMNYQQGENATRALIVVTRSGGSNGAVAVNYATSNGSAVAGKNYMPASGMLSWADGDSSPMAFSVPMIDDGVQDGTHTVNLTLSGPTGGATLGTSMATLAITDADQPASPAGNIEFLASVDAVAENAGSFPNPVLRNGGSAGAVSVHYATSNGTGMAGVHYTATSGTLSWASGDSASKSFVVEVLDDGKADGDHTVNLTLSNPSGGAVLGSPATSVLTIINTDGGGPNAPAAPSNLSAAGSSTSSIHLTWKRNSTNETLFHLQFKVLDGSPFQDTLPLLPAGTTSTTVNGLQAATGYGFRVQAENGSSGGSAFTPEADAATDATPGPCIADANTLCLGGRFKATVAWKSATGAGAGTTVPLAANPDSGLFYFFSPSNIEMLIKVINGCSLSNTYWVFFAATTNVQFAVTVTDTMTGKTNVYFNPLNQAAVPVQDTSAFATCP